MLALWGSPVRKHKSWVLCFIIRLHKQSLASLKVCGSSSYLLRSYPHIIIPRNQLETSAAHKIKMFHEYIVTCPPAVFWISSSFQSIFKGSPMCSIGNSLCTVTNKGLFEKPFGTQNEFIQRFSWPPDFEVTSFLKNNATIPQTTLGKYFLNTFFCLALIATVVILGAASHMLTWPYSALDPTNGALLVRSFL